MGVVVGVSVGVEIAVWVGSMGMPVGGVDPVHPGTRTTKNNKERVNFAITWRPMYAYPLNDAISSAARRRYIII